MVGKLRSLGRHRREDPSVRQASILVQRCCFLTAEPFLAHAQLLFCTTWLVGVEGLIPLVSLFWMVDGDSAGRGPSAHSCLMHSLYTRRVLLHPHCPRYCQMSISEQHCVWINFVCVCVYTLLYVCLHLFCPSWGWGGDSCGVCLASGCQWATSITDATQLVHT